MKGDFSRNTFDPNKQYRGVLMQQGRVDLDAEWNEQQEIARYLEQTANADVIGHAGTPAEHDGFAIELDAGKMYIGSGRYYVDGMLCENETRVEYENQPDYPNVAALGDMLSKGNHPLTLVYLDVWNRHITALDDPSIREQALGADGPDTTTRIKNIWQVKVLPVTPDVSLLTDALKNAARLLRNAASQNEKLPNFSKKLAEIIAEIIDFLSEYDDKHWDGVIGIYAQTIEALIAPSIFQGDEETVDAALQDTVRRAVLLLEGAFLAFEANLCKQDFAEWQAIIREATGTLNARTQPVAHADCACQLPPEAGYSRLDNQLYRVEIMKNGDLANKEDVTFVWSRDNGSVVTSIVSPKLATIGMDTVTVDSLGPDNVIGFGAEDWVEIIDDVRELNGLPGQIVKIKKVEPALQQITFDQPLLSDFVLNPKMRRWDGWGQAKLPAGADDWVDIESGIQIQFAAGVYKTGDHWLIPARTASGQIEWPVGAGGSPIAQLPLGIRHHYGRLALLWHERIQGGDPIGREKPKEGFSPDTLQVRDCRAKFPSLTTRPKSLRVLGTSWQNDGIVRYNNQGQLELSIVLDGAPDRNSLLNGSSVRVTIDYPNHDPFESFTTLTLPGQIDVVGNVIRWIGKFAAISSDVRPEVAVLRLPWESLTAPYRMRVTLRGNAIWRSENPVQTEPVELPITRAPSDLRLLRSSLSSRLTTIATRGSRSEAAVPQWQEASTAERVYLDGQTFASPGARSNLPIDAQIAALSGFPATADGTVSRTQVELRFPSGTGKRASDFESWFYFVPARYESDAFKPIAYRFFAKEPGLPAPSKPVASDVQSIKRDERVNIIQVDFTRPIRLNGFQADDLQKGMTLSLANEDSVAGTLKVSEDRKSVRFIHAGEQPFQAGDYIIRIAKAGAEGVLVTVAEDGASLEDDYFYRFRIE